MANKGSFHKILAVISFILVGFIFITTTSTHAGFEWVPAQQNPAPDVVDLPPVSSEPAPVTVMPVPQEQSPAPISPKPLSSQSDLAPPASEQSTMKVIRVQKPATTPAPLAEQKESIDWSNKRVEVRPTQPDPVVEAPLEYAPPPPPVVQTKIIMPEDAPESALLNAENSEKLLGVAPVETESTHISSTPDLPEEPVFEEAVGFGSDMPLGFALSQVVPAGYAYSFGKDVNTGSIVSWNGGKAWNIVVSDMVKPLGLALSIQDKKVLIYNPQSQIVEEKHSDAADTSPASLIEEPAQLAEAEEKKRMNIVVPTEESSAQPEETMVKIERIAQAQQGEPISLIETASGEPEETAVSAPYKDVRFWKGKKGQSVKELLNEWTQDANVDLVWEAPHDFTLANNLLVSDSFENALRTLLTQALEEEKAPSMTLMETPGAETSATLMIKG